MKSDPARHQEPFNQLVDAAKSRGFRVGLRTGEELHTQDRNEQWRDIAAIECTIKADLILVEMIGSGGFQVAAHALLTRLPTRAT